jgi:uncharacterized protein with HEPN domain
MKNKPVEFFLEHIIEAIEKINELKEENSYESFMDDWHISDLIIRQIEVIGEASKQLPENFKQRYSKVPWRDITDMRNNLIHRYFGVEKDIIWQVINKDIPKLMKDVKNILEDLDR